MNTETTLTFLGGAGTVTGSKYLVTVGNQKLLLDCGLFQGQKSLRRRNWDEPQFDAKSIAAVILSHAHIDHSGYLPLLARNGFNGPVFCTGGTKSLLNILLPDAAHIQEEDAAFANRHGFSKHHPASPLYTNRHASRTLELVHAKPYQREFQPISGVWVTFRRAGHILGSATVELKFDQLDGRSLVFSGDLGRWRRPMLRDPDPVPRADILLVESTYGDRSHPDIDVRQQLQEVISAGAERGGAILIPAFAVGRTQELIWMIRELEEAKRIPKLPVYIDSPMATDVTSIFCEHPEDHDIDMKLLMDQHKCPLCCQPYQFTRTPAQSKALNRIKGPMIIIASSGMATAGRIVHHLKQRLPDKKTTVVLVGYQAAGTRGRSLQDGAASIRMHGRDIPVNATVETISGLSAHADRDEILRWLHGFKEAPQHTYVVHGEPGASASLAATLKDDWGWDASVAEDGASVPLDA